MSPAKIQRSDIKDQAVCDEGVAIRVQDLHKEFKLPHERHSSLKQAALNIHRRSFERQKVLDGVSFEIKKGEFFGIVGRNGSGKSTLLKILAGIYTPTSGRIQVNGALTPFIELGVGFNPELTGRDNVYLNGAIFGLTTKQIDEKYDEIVAFAELEKFMDQKLKNYSSGMQVRLAFSIAIQANTEILMLDEVLAVGDEAFQRKCNEFFKKIKQDKHKTVVLVTHSMESVRNYCDRAMLINRGIVEILDLPDRVADEYYGLNLLGAAKQTQSQVGPQISAKITSERLLRPSDTLKMEIKYKAENDNPVCSKVYIDLGGQPIMATNPKLLGWGALITRDTKEHIATYSVPLRQFNKGEYKVIALLEDVESGVNIANFGYGGETVIKIENREKSSSAGILLNQATMDLLT